MPVQGMNIFSHSSQNRFIPQKANFTNKCRFKHRDQPSKLFLLAFTECYSHAVSFVIQLSR